MARILLVLAYGLLKGGRELVKKKALTVSTVMEVLVVYTALSMVMVLPFAPEAGGLTMEQYLWVALKALCVFSAWMCSFRAIKKMPVSLYGILDLSRVVFSTLLGAFVLREALRVGQMAGLTLVCIGLFMLKQRKSAPGQADHVPMKFVLMALASCLLNGLSGTMDKVLMKDMTSAQLQFWYTLFMLAMYLVYVFVTRTDIDWKRAVTNKWIWLLAAMFVVGDKCLFIANGMPESRVTVMTLIKQSGCLVTIIGGKLVFGEKNIRYKLMCAAVVVAGIVVAVI
jgi:drug/metabolite transporter (DMT)-like permease